MLTDDLLLGEQYMEGIIWSCLHLELQIMAWVDRMIVDFERISNGPEQNFSFNLML
jgi:hypothetical protein